MHSVLDRWLAVIYTQAHDQGQRRSNIRYCRYIAGVRHTTDNIRIIESQATSYITRV